MNHFGMTERKNFCRWVRRVRELIVEAGCYPTVEAAEAYGSDDDWRSYFYEGYTPGEALQEEFSYA